MHEVNDDSTTRSDVTAATDPLYRTTWSGERSLHETVLDAVATVSNTTRAELDPLQDYVDVDALEAVVTSLHEGSVTFTYAEYEIVVWSTGGVTVWSRDE